MKRTEIHDYEITPKEHAKLAVFAVFVLLPILITFWVVSKILSLFQIIKIEVTEIPDSRD